MLPELIKIVIFGSLSLNMTLTQVGYNRQTLAVEIPIDDETDVSEYECRIGVPYGYKHLIGKEVYFFPIGEYSVYGPYLVTDVEADVHRGQMFSRKLAADIDCPNLVHMRGYLIEYRTR